MDERQRNQALRTALAEVGTFSRGVVGLRLRGYQLAAVEAVLAAVARREGGTYVVEFARQSGKDEAVAQLLAYLLLRRKQAGGTVVMAAPTVAQVNIAKRRLKQRLDNPLTAKLWQTEGAHSIRLSQARATFLTAQPSANVRGHTADLLLAINEAQDVERSVYEARFAPMTASSNAPTLLMGTPWRNDSLLSWAKGQAEREQQADGRPHLFMVDWQQVAAEVPSYGRHVEARVAQLGWQHPFIQSEYCLRELDSANTMFDPHRIAQMQGTHSRHQRPYLDQSANHDAEASNPPFNIHNAKLQFALLLDVAGEAEAEEWEIRAANPRKDSAALTVVAIDNAGPLPRYYVVDRREWLGVRHTALHDTILDLAENLWRAGAVVVDATGVGAGLASFLKAKLGRRLIPFIFTAASKSKLGWDFLALVESGRYKDYADDGAEDSRRFWQQVAACRLEILRGPHKQMRWSVPDPLVHDDLLISAALTAALDGLDLKPRRASGRNY